MIARKHRDHHAGKRDAQQCRDQRKFLFALAVLCGLVLGQTFCTGRCCVLCLRRRPLACLRYCAAICFALCFSYHLADNPFRSILHDILIFKADIRVLFKLLDRAAHFACRLVTVGRIFGHGLFRDLHKRHGNLRRKLVQCRGLIRNVPHGHLHGIFPIKRQAARQHFVHDHAHRIKISGLCGCSAAGLLGADIMHRANGFVAFGHALLTRKTGNAEIHHFQAAVSQQHNVLGLYIAMYHPLAVGVFQRTQDLLGKMHHFFPG